MRMLIVDANPVPWWHLWRPEPWFQAGGHISDYLDTLVDLIDQVIDIDATGTFDEVVFAYDVDDAYEAIEQHRPRYVEVHGHGAPGRPLIGRKALDPRHRCWRHVKRVWFRSCEVAQGERGHAFFAALTMTTDVVAHVSRISGIAQSYLVGVKKGGKPWWSTRLKSGSSRPGDPRTIGPLDALPKWAFKEGMTT